MAATASIGTFIVLVQATAPLLDFTPDRCLRSHCDGRNGTRGPIEREHYNGIRLFPIRLGYFDYNLVAGLLDCRLSPYAEHGCGHDLGVNCRKPERMGNTIGGVIREIIAVGVVLAIDQAAALWQQSCVARCPRHSRWAGQIRTSEWRRGTTKRPRTTTDCMAAAGDG